MGLKVTPQRGGDRGQGVHACTHGLSSYHHHFVLSGLRRLGSFRTGMAVSLMRKWRLPDVLEVRRWERGQEPERRESLGLAWAVGERGQKLLSWGCSGRVG